MTTHIRLATIADLGAVEVIVAAAYGPYVARIGRKPAPMLEDYAALIAAGVVHVLDDAGTLRGLVVLLPEDDAMLLDNVAVSPEAHGRGFGRALLVHAERIARGAGYRTIRLYTNELMTENIALYGRTGYVETHRAVQEGHRRVYMLKAVPGRGTAG